MQTTVNCHIWRRGVSSSRGGSKRLVVRTPGRAAPGAPPPPEGWGRRDRWEEGFLINSSVFWSYVLAPAITANQWGAARVRRALCSAPAPRRLLSSAFRLPPSSEDGNLAAFRLLTRGFSRPWNSHLQDGRPGQDWPSSLIPEVIITGTAGRGTGAAAVEGRGTRGVLLFKPVIKHFNCPAEVSRPGPLAGKLLIMRWSWDAFLTLGDIQRTRAAQYLDLTELNATIDMPNL